MIRDSKKTFTDYFRKPVDPKELVRKWQADIRAEQRQIEKQIRCFVSYVVTKLSARWCEMSEACGEAGGKEGMGMLYLLKRGSVSSTICWRILG